MFTEENLRQINLIIPQSNQHDIEFNRNENSDSYELVVDVSFWAQPYPIEIFLEKVTQKYAMEHLVGESQKLGFQVIDSQKKLINSLTKILPITNIIIETANYILSKKS